ncbi:MAG TPA: PAS domain S-box protein, partial [Dissulfurispiraceae bacterium]|nr:PAS domain S-box protein [Dissulfurispiraceae bacterium]
MARQKSSGANHSVSEDSDVISREALEERIEDLSRDLTATLVRLKRERTRKNEALRASQEVFQQFFDQNEEALLVLQPETCAIIDANPAAASLFGYERDELIEKGPSLFVDSEELHNLRQIISSTDASDDRRVLTYRKRDGDKGILSFRVRVIKLRDRDVVFSSFRDITDEIRSRADVRFRQAQLIYTNKMASLGLLMAGVAHEISSPNNSI